jgi:hypothetical protein
MRRMIPPVPSGFLILALCGVLLTTGSAPAQEAGASPAAVTARESDPAVAPIFLLRSLFVTTQEGSVEDSAGVSHSSTDLRRTFLGHREGFVLENAELGLKGRLKDSGLYFSGKVELVPREKDGTKSEGDYLKEVYAGWNPYSFLDARFGRIKIPFGQANLKGATEQAGIYLPLLDTLLPKRMIGASITLSDPWQIARLSGGAFNSVKEPHEQMARLSQLLYVARLEVRADRVLDRLGVQTGELLNLQLGGGIGYCQENYDPRSEMRYLGVDGRLDLSIVTLEAELLLKDYYNQVADGKDAIRGMAWHTDLVVHAWPGLLDVLARLEQADANQDNVVDFADTASMSLEQKKRWLTLGLLLHASRQVAVAVNYVHRSELEGYSLTNDMFLTLLQFNL